MCEIAEIVVVGGVRRSALISLSNLSDDRMRHAKSGSWWENNTQRALANNSAVYTERPEFETFLEEWLSLYKSKAGERGIFSRIASQNQASKNGRRETDHDFGTNPCSEIILRSGQVCNLSEIVVVGGVRRSALISLSNLSDDRMRHAKSGSWWENNTQRALANNSAVYTERPEFETFLEEWLSLYKSKAGERGIFSRIASQNQASKNGRRETDHDFGTNPCSEIILRSGQVCNLSEIVVRSSDTLKIVTGKLS